MREFVKIFGVRKRGAVHALHSGIAGLDDVILVGRMRAVAMAESEMPGGQAKRLAGENVTRPGARQSRRITGSMPLFLYTAVAARMTAESAGVEVGS